MDNNVSVMSVENYQVLVRTGNHGWVADEPASLGGDGLGPNPFDMLLASLGSCLAITVVHLAARARLPLVRLWVELHGHPAEPGSGGRYAISVKLRARGELSDQDMARLGRYAEQCPVHHILSAGTRLEMSLERA